MCKLFELPSSMSAIAHIFNLHNSCESQKFNEFGSFTFVAITNVVIICYVILEIMENVAEMKNRRGLEWNFQFNIMLESMEFISLAYQFRRKGQGIVIKFTILWRLMIESRKQRVSLRERVNWIMKYSREKVEVFAVWQSYIMLKKKYFKLYVDDKTNKCFLE